MKFDLKKYLENSSIHGLVYITNKNHLIERIFWIIALIFSIICTSVLISELVEKIQNYPIVTFLSDQSIPVSEINFPAVTVCPQFQPILENDVYGRFIYRYEKHTLDAYKILPKELNIEYSDEIRLGNLSYYEYLDAIEDGSVKIEDIGMKMLKRLQVVDLITNHGVFQKLNISIPTDDFLGITNEFAKSFKSEMSLIFMWIDQQQNYMSEIITPWGLCFTYNIAFNHDLLNLNAVSDDFHYELTTRVIPNARMERKPTKMPKTISTSKAGLWVGFGRTHIEDEGVKNDFNGYVVLFHDPFELPSKMSKIVKTNFDHRTKVFVDPQLNSIDESLYDYEPKDRNCYLEDEKVLEFFKVYTKNNCENECLSSFVLNRCGCVEFFMIRNSTTRICSANEESCYKKASFDFEEQMSSCECFEPCNSVKYEFDVNEFGLTQFKALAQHLEIGFLMLYKTSLMTELVHKKQFNELDFLSFVGGILGLFAGFSALSFVELIYWFTVRVVLAKFGRTDAQIHPQDNQNPSKLQKFKDFVTLYFSESSIHGLNHVFELSKIGSIFWTFFILSAMTLCFHLILSAPEKVPNSQVIGYDDDFKVLDNIPFPAITIVPAYTIPLSMMNEQWIQTAHSYSYGGKFIENERTREQFKQLLTRFHFCANKYHGYSNGYDFSFVPYLFLILKLNSFTHWFTEQYSSFSGKFEPEFAEIRTSRGMGFAFNIIDADKMFDFNQTSLDFKYYRDITTLPEMDSPPLKYPIKLNKIERYMFSVTLEVPDTGDFPCLMQSYLIHEPDYLPTFSSRNEFINFEYGTTVDVLVTPEIIQTDDDLRKVKPEDRECYFEGEKILKHFKTYSQKNCEIECLTAFTVERCGCVDINQPYKNVQDLCLNTSRSKDSCFTKIQYDLYESENFSYEKNCSCLPMCNSVTFKTRLYTKYEDNGTVTIINVKMNMDDIILYRRYQQFTFSDVVSYVGGLLGLFAGISMLSIVEFFYFFTIRLGVNLWRGLRLR